MLNRFPQQFFRVFVTFFAAFVPAVGLGIWIDIPAYVYLGLGAGYGIIAVRHVYTGFYNSLIWSVPIVIVTSVVGLLICWTLYQFLWF